MSACLTAQLFRQNKPFKMSACLTTQLFSQSIVLSNNFVTSRRFYRPVMISGERARCPRLARGAGEVQCFFRRTVSVFMSVVHFWPAGIACWWVLRPTRDWKVTGSERWENLLLQLVSWCFKPSQPQRIISGLKETFVRDVYSWKDQYGSKKD